MFHPLQEFDQAEKRHRELLAKYRNLEKELKDLESEFFNSSIFLASANERAWEFCVSILGRFCRKGDFVLFLENGKVEEIKDAYTQRRGIKRSVLASDQRTRRLGYNCIETESGTHAAIRHRVLYFDTKEEAEQWWAENKQNYLTMFKD
jgi:hypothetical protein